MQLQFFAPLMNTFMNESIYNLFLLCFWGAPAHQGTGRGRKGQGGSHYVRENAQLSGGEADPPVSFREASDEQSCKNKILTPVV